MPIAFIVLILSTTLIKDLFVLYTKQGTARDSVFRKIIRLIIGGLTVFLSVWYCDLIPGLIIAYLCSFGVIGSCLVWISGILVSVTPLSHKIYALITTVLLFASPISMMIFMVMTYLSTDAALSLYYLAADNPVIIVIAVLILVVSFVLKKIFFWYMENKYFTIKRLFRKYYRSMLKIARKAPDAFPVKFELLPAIASVCYYAVSKSDIDQKAFVDEIMDEVYRNNPDYDHKKFLKRCTLYEEIIRGKEPRCIWMISRNHPNFEDSHPVIRCAMLLSDIIYDPCCADKYDKYDPTMLDSFIDTLLYGRKVVMPLKDNFSSLYKDCIDIIEYKSTQQKHIKQNLGKEPPYDPT